MPLPVTHALVPVVGALAFVRGPIPWRLIAVAPLAAMAPDIDSLNHHFAISEGSMWAHRGLFHSLFIAVVAGTFVGGLHRALRVKYLSAAAATAVAMATHGILDMMADRGLPVAYLWPLSTTRLYADWRPIHSVGLQRSTPILVALDRLGGELLQVIVPLIAAAIVFRLIRAAKSRHCP